jgi:hypothetical protein
MKKGYFVKKVVPQTTNNITTAIVNFLDNEGHKAMRVNTQGQFEQITPKSFNYMKLVGVCELAKMYGYVVGKWRKSNSTEGVSDVLCSLKPIGKFFAIEVKFGADRTNAAQKDFLKNICDTGGITYIAQDYQSFLDFYNNTVKPQLSCLKQ